MRLDEFLLQNVNGHVGIPIPDITESIRRKLQERIKACCLGVHSFSFYHNFNKGEWDPSDMLQFAHRENLQGMNIKIFTGGKRALAHKSDAELLRFRDQADNYGIKVNLEVSSTEFPDVERATEIACRLQSGRIRCYIRNRSDVLLSTMKERETESLRQIVDHAEKNDVYFDLEGHEALKADEVNEFIESTRSNRLGSLFDFGNPVNANEDPLEALRRMAPYIRQVHLKTIKLIPETHPKYGTGNGQLGVHGDENELPQAKLLFDLLMLGDDKAHQVQSFVVQQENGYTSPARRFSNEPDDPLIKGREESKKPLKPELTMKQNCEQEVRDARQGVKYYKNLLAELDTLACST